MKIKKNEEEIAKKKKIYNSSKTKKKSKVGVKFERWKISRQIKKNSNSKWFFQIKQGVDLKGKEV